jgi:hypothetical protein
MNPQSLMSEYYDLERFISDGQELGYQMDNMKPTQEIRSTTTQTPWQDLSGPQVTTNSRCDFSQLPVIPKQARSRPINQMGQPIELTSYEQIAKLLMVAVNNSKKSKQKNCPLHEYCNRNQYACHYCGVKGCVSSNQNPTKDSFLKIHYLTPEHPSRPRRKEYRFCDLCSSILQEIQFIKLRNPRNDWSRCGTTKM